MTRDLFRALAGRLAALTVAAVVLAGLAGHAAVTRPGPLVITMSCYDPAAGVWLACSTAGPAEGGSPTRRPPGTGAGT